MVSFLCVPGHNPLPLQAYDRKLGVSRQSLHAFCENFVCDVALHVVSMHFCRLRFGTVDNHVNMEIQYNTKNFYSACILGVAKFKGVSSQNPSNRKLKSRGKPYSSSRDREINWLRRIYARPKRCFFRRWRKQVMDSEERINKGSLFQREGAQTLKTLVPVLVLHLGADKRGPLLKRRYLLGVARWIRLAR